MRERKTAARVGADFDGICFSARVFERVLLQSDESGKRGA